MVLLQCSVNQNALACTPRLRDAAQQTLRASLGHLPLAAPPARLAPATSRPAAAGARPRGAVRAYGGFSVEVERGFGNDLKQGYGTYIWGRSSKWAGQRYAGAYAHDRRHGAGVYTWPDGRELAGQWREDQPPAALPPEMQATVRAHAERMVALSHPGAKVCRNVPVGIVQVDVVRGTVLAMTGGQVRIRIESVGTFSNQMDGRVIAKGDELLVEPDDWFPCR